MEVKINEKSSHIKGRLAVICGSLGHLSDGEYLIEPDCAEGIKDLIRLLKKDDGTHLSRRCMGEMNLVQNHLIHIIKTCPSDMEDLFQVTLRLMINLTTPAMLLYCEEIPRDKSDRHFYLTLVGHDQSYKLAFADVEFWNKISCKLTNLFEIDWAERSTEDGIGIERILTLLRNVLQIPSDLEDERKPDNDETIHDKVLRAFRQSQILELLLLVASKKDEEPYYLNLLEIFSLVLREQNPRKLARVDLDRSEAEKMEETKELMRACESQKNSQRNYSNVRNFRSTFVLKGVKTISNVDKVFHTSLNTLKDLNLGENKIPVKPKRNRIPVESERIERISTLSVRLLLKEFCLELLNNGFENFITVVKNRLDSGKSLANDKTYYFWAISFFFRFAIESNANVELVKNCLSPELFHFVQTNMDSAFEHLNAEKKNRADWVKRIHTILKAYQSMLETLLWMDCSKSPLVRSISREIKQNIFYVVEYREMTLHLLLRYEPAIFPASYLRDLVQTTHLFVKLLEEYSKQTKLVVQKITKKRKSKKRSDKRVEATAEVESGKEKWDKISSDVYDSLLFGTAFPEIPPFDAASDIPIDEQKDKAMKRIQKLLREGNVTDAVGLLRSSRQVWPENDYFGQEGMTAEEETMALQEICLADLGETDSKEVEGKKEPGREKSVAGEIGANEEEDEEEEEEEEDASRIVEQDFDLMEYKKRLVHKKVVESCGILLKNYKKNSEHVNHCAVKMLHRIGWECCMPAMLYQGSLFCTLFAIMNEKDVKRYQEINTFTVNLVRKFRKHAVKNPVVFLELLFWKDNRVALQIQHGYDPYEENKRTKKRIKTSRKKKTKGGGDGDGNSDGDNSGDARETEAVPKRKRTARKKKEAKEGGKSKKGEKAARDGKIEEDILTGEKSDSAGASGDESGDGDSGKQAEELEKHSDLESAMSGDEGTDVVDDRPTENTAKSDASSDDVEEDANESKASPRPRPEKEEGGDSGERTGKKGGETLVEIAEETTEETFSNRTRKKSKRIRCISSDSDAEECESVAGEKEMATPSGKRRKSVAVIESDSDLEDFDNDFASK